ncbi:hypothetical protein ACJMK2_035138 [Sinanodonta woodiana]|uniref:PLAT domain-containing protein n=1 Tax=Sinanodonta woodiana TaxID=1069815 RepID=A0ABD3WXE9_SINWO
MTPFLDQKDKNPRETLKRCFGQLGSVNIYRLLGSDNDYASDISGINQQVVAKWFPLGDGNKITSVCNLSSLKITIKPRVPWRGSDMLLEWTLDTSCNVIISWIIDHSKFVTQWFEGNVGSGNITIPCSFSSTTTIISVFALTYISNRTDILPSIESRHVPVKCYFLDDFYVEFDKFIPSIKVPVFKVGVNGTKDYLNENIMLEWLWGDTTTEVFSFMKSTFSHNYNTNGYFRASLILKYKASSRAINVTFYRGDLKFSVNTLNGNISSTEFKFSVLDYGGQILSNFSRKYNNAGAYTVTFGYACSICSEIIMIDNAMVGIQITVDNPIESLVIETNNRTRYPPAQVTLNISVPSDHLPVQNMKCLLDMDDFIDRKTYSIFSPKVTSELKITFNYTYLTLGDHYIRVSCESFASRKETIQIITVYHDCLSQGGCFDFQYAGEDTAMNTHLNFETEIGNRKDVRYDSIPIYTWTIEERLLNGSYSLTDNMTSNSDNFPIQANTRRDRLYRLNLRIEFQFPKCDYYQEFTYIKFNRVPLRQSANDSTRIDCLYNCFERVATRHILHLRLNCLRCTNLTWTLPAVNDKNVMLSQIAHFGINSNSLIIRGGSLKPGTKYNIKVNFTKDNNISYIFTNFTTNIPPSNGACEINPSIGFASETLYTISCAGWIDDDPYGIYYQYIFQSGDRNNTEHILYAGYENKSFSMYLPVGAKDDEYRAHISVRITDGFGDYTEYVLTVAIFPSKIVRDALDGNSTFTDISAYLKLLENNITVASLSGHITRSVRCIESAASNNALIPLPYQGITLLPDDLYLIGFYKDEFEKKVSFTWETYWKDRAKPRDKRQQSVLTEFQVIECAEQLKTNLVTIASTYDYSLQNHENITLAAGGLVRLVSKMLKVVHPLLTAYFPQNRTVKVMRNFLQYAQEFFDVKIYENRTILLQEQTFIAMRELLRIELEKEEKKRILVVFRDNPYYWGWSGERISSRVIEYIFNPEDAFQKSNVRISLPNEGILKRKPTPYTDSEDNSTIKYLFYSFDRQCIEDDVLIFINASSEELLYDIYLNYDVRPSLLNNTYRTSVTKSDWTKDGFRIIIRAEYIRKTGAVHLAFVPHLEGTNTTDRPEIYLYVTSVQCYNWNGSDWDHRACNVSEESSLDTSICLCETTSPNFTAGTTFYFPLNIQAFDVPAVDQLYPGAYLIFLAFAIALFLYVIVLIWACVIDSVDENVWQFNFLSDGQESHKYFYLLRVYTGFGPKRGTTSDIYFDLAGSINNTGVRRLTDSTGKPHDSGSIRNYVMGVARHLGCLMSLNIWLDKSGVHDGSWFLRKVIVDDVHTNTRTIFNCNKWLSFSEEVGKTEGIFSSSTDEGVCSLRYRLSTNIPHYLAYINIWSSIFVRMHPSEFSRVGRVTGALILVTALMATILVLPQYVSLTEERKKFIVGPLRFSLKNTYNALTSVVITVPVMYLLFAVLHKSNIQNKSCSPWRSFQRKILKLLYRDKLDCYLKSGDELDGCIYVKKTSLPVFCGALTWIVLLAIFCISVFYIIQITPRINKEDAETWLTTFLISIFVSIFVFEPFMVLSLALLASLLGRLCDPRQPMVNINGLRSRNIWRCNFQTKCTVQANVPRSPLHKTQRAIRRLRRKMLSKSHTWFLIMEMFAYSVFFVVAYILALSSTDQRACELKEQLEKRLQFDKITGRTNFLQWMSSTFFDLYFPVKVYNTTDVPHDLKYHFIDFTNIRVGPARLRQVRGKIGSSGFKAGANGSVGRYEHCK